jgi:ABC-2 type transport system ATP-binding protein
MIVDVDGVSVVYGGGLRGGGRTALDHVSLHVEEGESFALIGPNGAGKSTLVYCLLGLLTPSSGSARVFGSVLEPGAAAFRDIAFVPEEPHYHDYLTVEEAVEYYAALSGEQPPPGRVTTVLAQLRLEKERKTRLRACSKGMKQKVGIARCLMHQPRLLILDEPMRGLDAVAVKDFRDVLIDLNRRGVTIVMNSHQLSEVEQLASRVAILAGGRVLAIKPIGELTREGSLEDSFLALLRASDGGHA